MEIDRKVRFMAESVEQIDIVLDVYRNDSHKRENWEVHGKNEGVCIVVKKTPIFHKFNVIVPVDENITKLNLLIADSLVHICHEINTPVVVTHREKC